MRQLAGAGGADLEDARGGSVDLVAGGDHVTADAGGHGPVGDALPLIALELEEGGHELVGQSLCSSALLRRDRTSSPFRQGPAARATGRT